MCMFVCLFFYLKGGSGLCVCVCVCVCVRVRVCGTVTGGPRLPGSTKDMYTAYSYC